MGSVAHSTTTAAPTPGIDIPASGGKQEGTIASVFATLSGGSLEDALPPRFSQLKEQLIRDDKHVAALHEAWRDVLSAVRRRVDETIDLGGRAIPQVQYPGKERASGRIDQWIDVKTLDQIKDRGVVVIKGVVPSEQALQWKEDIRSYANLNHAKGFPEDNPQVYELYWSKSQLAARSHPDLLQTSRAFLSLFHAPAQSQSLPVELSASLSNPLSYADRLRIQQPGDAKFALGPHIDGGGVERWECENFRGLWHHIMAGGTNWRKHDPWSLGRAAERLSAKTDMYDGPGQCGVFRPLQGWLSMSSTRANEGTLRVLPFLKESTAYIVLRPFFEPKKRSGDMRSEDLLSLDNWRFDGTSAKFPGCSLGHNIELSTVTHPHLALDQTMVSVPSVEPGDMVLWHCDGVHSVEAEHRGTGDSSVMYIPAIPTTKVNFDYVREQRNRFERGIPPQDFPGGSGESQFSGRGGHNDIIGGTARRSMALEPFDICRDQSESEKRLLEYCNARI